MITTLSATQLARRIRERTLSPVDAVEAHIARIEALNMALNAVVTPTFDQARREARAEPLRQSRRTMRSGRYTAGPNAC